VYNRKNGRSYLSVRDIAFKLNPFGYAEASILYEQGNTKIFATVGLQQGVPKFLKGSGNGWLTAEYVMHPYACEKNRSQREIHPAGRDFRSIEISRLIGRAFRSVVDTKQLGERTLYLDCDVLQADGGTRTACINALTIALLSVQKIWLANRQVYSQFFKIPLIGVSVGIVDGKVLLDLDKIEDNRCVADFNFIMTHDGKIVESQGTAEASPVSWDDFDQCRDAAILGVNQISKFLGL